VDFGLAGLQDEGGYFAVMVRLVRRKVADKVCARPYNGDVVVKEFSAGRACNAQQALAAFYERFAQLWPGVLFRLPDFFAGPALRVGLHPYADAVVDVRKDLRHCPVVSGFACKKFVRNAIQQLYGLGTHALEQF